VFGLTLEFRAQVASKTLVFETPRWHRSKIACWIEAPVAKLHLFIIVFLLDIYVEFWDNKRDMPLPEQKKKLLKAKIAVALHDELGRVPKKEEIDNVFLLARVLYKAVLGLHYKRQEQKKNGQLAIF
jgi:hypothetical protein